MGHQKSTRDTQQNVSKTPGKNLEEVVARIQQMMDPKSTVTHNEVLHDRVGNKRQYDVVIRGQFGGRLVLGIIECKDHCRKKGPDAVEAFAKKTENLGANLRLIVSRRGFTKQALQLAKHENIGCLSLLPDHSEQVGFSIGDMWYGIIRKWTNIRLFVNLATPSISLPAFDPHTVKWKGKPVANWFLKELFTTYGGETKTGDLKIDLKFTQPREIEVAGNEFSVSSISCTAERIYRKKRKWVSWSGDAFFDWNANKISIPANGTIVGSGVETDLDAWPDYDGNIPEGEPHTGLVRAILYETQNWDPTQDNEIPDLTSL